MKDQSGPHELPINSHPHELIVTKIETVLRGFNPLCRFFMNEKKRFYLLIFQHSNENVKGIS